ncbi:hypothetical protein [Pseudonocardia sp. ICBG162]|uniref:hypothetical protein n=1 Tax=Pseudonocardia sp. ICBG162 TaxID=2846761 RepID=UPI001CF6B16F|nr:hypothetical protein [Pseudonocardia sp. ICBG162]
MGTPDRHVVDGRTVLTRAALCETFGIARHQAERLWSKRAMNQHPPAVLREGARQWWDQEEMARFLAAVTGRKSPETIEVDGRTLHSRAALARHVGVSVTYLRDIYHRRKDDPPPAPVLRRGRSDYFDAQAWQAWWNDYQAGQRRTLTTVDRTGDPDELVGIPEAARVLGYRRAETARSYLSRNPGYFPEPDGHDEHGRRLYARRTLWAFADGRTRPGRAGRTPDA